MLYTNSPFRRRLEESLKSQVATAFKRQRWSEHWLQSAKGIVRRSKLLGDAAYIMAAYAQNESARRRRLEIQFTGESGERGDGGEGGEGVDTRNSFNSVLTLYLQVSTRALANKPA